MDKTELPVPYAGMTRIRFKGSSRWFEFPRPRRHLSLQTEAPLGTAMPVLDRIATPRQEHDAAFRPKGATRPSGPAADRLSDHGHPLRRRRAGIAAPGLSPGRSCLLSWLDNDNLRDRSAAGAAVAIPGAVARELSPGVGCRTVSCCAMAPPTALPWGIPGREMRRPLSPASSCSSEDATHSSG